MLKEKTRDIELSGKKYRLNKMDARTGSYVAAKVAIIAAPLLKSSGKINEQNLATILPSLNRNDFDELQTILLKTVYRYADNGMVEPICTANGTIFDEELAYDVKTVIALTVHAVMFNCGDFFNEAGLMNPAEI